MSLEIFCYLTIRIRGDIDIVSPMLVNIGICISISIGISVDISVKNYQCYRFWGKKKGQNV